MSGFEVLRVEHASELNSDSGLPTGPYAYDWYDFADMFVGGAMLDSSYANPAWALESWFSDTILSEPTRGPWESASMINIVAAFANQEQFLNWFSPVEIENLSRGGFVLARYRVRPDAEAYFALTQIAVCLRGATRIERVDLRDLAQLVASG